VARKDNPGSAGNNTQAVPAHVRAVPRRKGK
jgi:hypothetical protein